MLPRRYFGTESKNTTSDIVRTRDQFNTKLLDNNDVASAYVVKDVINNQDDIISRLVTLEAQSGGSTTGLGTLDDFISSVDLNK